MNEIKLKTKNLRVPLKKEDVKNLKIGDIVYVSGKLYTGRSLFHIRAIEDGILPPLNFKKMNCFLHVGPVMRKVMGKWEPVSIDPTSSIRFEKYGGAVVKKLGIRAVIGKTTMGRETMAAMREVGCVHLSKIGIYGNVLASRIKRVVDVYFIEELGKTEATWVFDVDNFGPFFVDIDSYGNNYFQELDREVDQRFKNVYKRFGIPENFAYTNVSA